MSGGGAPVLRAGSVGAEAAGLRVAVVSASWHAEVMRGLRDGARRALTEAGVGDVLEVVVPGTFELPVAATRLAANGVDAVVALGVVVRGATPHFDYVCDAATSGLTEVTVRTGVPIGFGVLTCATDEQAFERSGLPGAKEDKGYEAALAAVATAVALRPFPVPPAGVWAGATSLGA